MKTNQLPLIFPLRYAIIIKTGNDEDFDDRPLLPDPKMEMLFKQYVLKLQQEPITKNHLRPAAYYIKANYFNIDIAYLAKLADNNESGTVKGWLSETKDAFIKMLPGVDVKSSGWGFFLDVSLYSYSGAFELPSFVKFWLETKKTSFDKARITFNLESSMFGFFYNKYQEILNNKLSSWDLYQILSQYRQPIRIEAPYSTLWKFLDSADSDKGIITPSIHKDENEEQFNLLPSQVENEDDKKIEIIVCRSWEELFAEELSAFYRTLTRCKNCNKPLPFNYTGIYCPDTPENIGCKKERNRIRKSQSRT